MIIWITYKIRNQLQLCDDRKCFSLVFFNLTFYWQNFCNLLFNIANGLDMLLILKIVMVKRTGHDKSK